MKLLKLGLRFWITIASVLSFIGGWIMLVHAPKPNQSGSIYNAAVSTQPTLEPLPPLQNFGGGDDDSQNRSFFNLQPPVQSQFRRSFRTGGS